MPCGCGGSRQAAREKQAQARKEARDGRDRRGIHEPTTFWNGRRKPVKPSTNPS